MGIDDTTPATLDLIGREHPAATLRAELTRTLDSHGGLVLVAGEAGIGKTTLVTRIADEARRQGALVVSGACWDSERAPGYWPWVQVARALRRHVTEAELGAAEDAAGPAFGVLLGHTPGAEVGDAFQLYDAVTSALVAVSQFRPVVVVLDDLHWADIASLRLLEFAARHTWFERLLLVGTYRDNEVESTDHVLRPLLSSLTTRATTVPLTGLEPTEVGDLIARTVGDRADDRLVAEVHRRTGGNPFFVEQTARLWHGGGSLTAVAPGVEDAVRRRLALLPDDVGWLLTAAAVLGTRFHREVLAAATGSPLATVDQLLDGAVAARLVVVRGEGEFAFVHDLVRETRYAALDEAERRDRHAAVVRALDAAPALAGHVFPADLARHAYLAGNALDPDRVIDLLLGAAHDASAGLAVEDATTHFRRALGLIDPGDADRWVPVALEFSHVLYHDDRSDEAATVLTEAAALARRQPEPRLLARVALAVFYNHNPQEERFKNELIREAHARLVGDDEPAAASKPAGQLATEVTVRLLSIARTGDDDETLGSALWTLHDTLFGPGTADQRMSVTGELVEVARRTAKPEMERYATALQWVALLELGDPRYLEKLREFVLLTELDSGPLLRIGALIDQAIVATHTGRFDEAENLLGDATAELAKIEHPFLSPMMPHIRWQLRYLQGTDENATATAADQPFAELAGAITATRYGDLGTALRYLANAPADLGSMPRTATPLWWRFQAQVAAAAGDAELCEQAKANLEPHAGHWLVSLFGFDVSGPVDHWLGTVEAAMGRYDPAIARFTAAVRSAETVQARPWVVEAKLGLAGALLGRAGEGDDAAAASLVDSAEREAARLGMRHIPGEIGRLRGRAVEPAEAEPGNEFRFTGSVWSLTMSGETVLLPDSKGLRDLHTLLGLPGTDVPAARLLNPAGGEEVVTMNRMGGDAVLDEAAKAHYKRRLVELDDEIDDASLRGDDDRAATLDRERAALLDELRTAAGLGGRTRRLGDQAERARKTVTARIRDTLRKLDERHPDLAAHLRASVSTGTNCRYDPATGVTWRL